MRPLSPWRFPDFRTLFTASALSHLGTNVGYVAVPLVAVTALDAGPGQVGALAALSTAAFLLIGLPAGAWVDRWSHRRVLIAADLARAALLVSVPVAWWLGVLTLGQLYAVVLLNGAATVFFDVGSQSMLPSVVGRDGLVPANSAMVSLMAVSNIGGRGAGGGLVQLTSGPAALVASVAGYLASAQRLTRIGRPARVPDVPSSEPPPEARSQARSAPPSQPRPDLPSPGMRAQIAEGLRHVFGDPRLRALALTATLTNLGAQMVNTMLPVVFTRELGLPEGFLGLYWAAGGVGILVGARCARPVAARLGYGRTLGLAGLCLAPASLLIPLIGHGIWLWAAGFGWLTATLKMGVDNVLGVSLRQTLTADALLGRMNATFRFVLTGALAVGAGLAGLIGQFVGVSAAMWTGGVCLAVAFVPVYLSPVRGLTALPTGPATDTPATADPLAGDAGGRPVSSTSR